VTCKETGCHAYQQVSDSSISANMVGKRRRSLLNTAVYPLQSINAAVNKRKILQTPSSPAPVSSPPTPSPSTTSAPPAPVDGDPDDGKNPYNDINDAIETAEEMAHALAPVKQLSPSPDEDNGDGDESAPDGPAPDGPAPDAPVDPASPSDPSDSGNSDANEGPAPDAPVDPAENPDPSDSGNSAAPADSGNESAPAAPAGGGDEPVPEDVGGGAGDEDPEVYGCFPRMATVQLHDGTQKVMYQLVPGDHVLSIDNQGQMKYSPVYVLPHAMPNVIYNYRKFTMAAIDHQMNDDSNATMATKVSFETTPDHYLLVATESANEKQDSLWSTRRAVRAAEVKVGDKMWMADKNKNTMELAIILDIEDILDEGIFSPLTLAGTIVVDGVVASVYTDMLGSEYNMHVFCAWGRWLYTIWPQFFTGMHQLKLAQPVATQIGYFAKAALKMTSVI
jgi:hypothetical protein